MSVSDERQLPIWFRQGGGTKKSVGDEAQVGKTEEGGKKSDKPKS